MCYCILYITLLKFGDFLGKILNFNDYLLRVLDMNSVLTNIQNKSAMDILNEYNSELIYPINIVDIARKRGFTVSGLNFVDLENEDVFKELVHDRGHILGAVFIDDKYAQILYNTELIEDGRFVDLSEDEKKDNLKKRQRFTVAHEIAHCALHMSSNDTVHIEFRNDQANNQNIRERQANIFAGELLMPTEIMLKIGKLCNYRFPIDSLSESFFVSRNVVRARIRYLVETGVFPSNATMYETVS